MLANEISSYPYKAIEKFAKELGTKELLPAASGSLKKNWTWSIIAMVHKWQAELSSGIESSRKEMALRLLNVESELENENFTPKRKPEFKKLARRIDMQGNKDCILVSVYLWLVIPCMYAFDV